MKVHTPGPWTAARCDDGIMMCQTEGDIICEAWMVRPNDAADFALIAASPDILAALLNVRRLISEAAMTGFNCKDGDWAERLFESQRVTSAAIAKAEGKQPTSVRGGE